MDEPILSLADAAAQKLLLTIPQTARISHMKDSSFYERSRHNALPGKVKIGKYVRIQADVFYDYVKNGGDLGQK